MTLKFETLMIRGNDAMISNVKIESMTDCEMAERISESAREFSRMRGTSKEFLAIADAVHMELKYSCAEFRKQQNPDEPIPDDEADLWPGRIAYVADASYVCSDCATSIRNPVMRGEETDSPQHCDSCGTLLDGFALTGDGVSYVVATVLETERDNETAESWLDMYSDEIDSLVSDPETGEVQARIAAIYHHYPNGNVVSRKHPMIPKIVAELLKLPADTKAVTNDYIRVMANGILHRMQRPHDFDGLSEHMGFTTFLDSVNSRVFAKPGMWSDLRISAMPDGDCVIAPELWFRFND